MRADDYAGAWEALKAGANPNLVTSTANTLALHYACKQNNIEMASLLLHFGANVSSQTATGWAPLHFAVNLENAEMCKLLRAYGARIDQINEWLKAPTDMARDKKNQQLIDVLKMSPSDLVIPSPRDPFSAKTPGVSIPDAASVAAAKPSSSLEKRLARAVKAKDPNATLEALEEGADVNWVNPITSIAPLHLAVKQNDLEVARVLLEKGADPNAQTKAGWTSMHFAVLKK